MRSVSLPYINNAKAVLLTAAINLGVVFLFYWPDGVAYRGALWDSLICAVITTAIDLWFVYARMLKVRRGGRMPSQVPVSRLMQRLPQNPFALGAVFMVGFGALTVGVNGAILWFFGLRSMAFVPWMAYKLLYSTVLSVLITEYCVFRYVQPDWASAAATDPGVQAGMKPIRDPMPKVSVLKAMYGSVTGNIATNMVVGLALGGITVAADSSVLIPPTTREGIPISGLIFGFIVGILVTRGVVKGVGAAAQEAGSPEPEAQVPDRRFSWMPRGKTTLTLFVCVCMMVFSALALWAMMTLFDIPVMNAYQYAVFITVYASVVSKPLSYVLVRRCTQPDYARRGLKKGGSPKGSLPAA